jgi:hypothetical protein
MLVAIDDLVLTPDPLEHVRLVAERLGAKSLVTADGGRFGYRQNRRELREALGLVAEMLPDPPRREATEALNPSRHENSGESGWHPEWSLRGRPAVAVEG